MIKKMTERSSAFVVVSRKTLVSGMAGIAVISFGLGYFLAYGGPTSDKLIKHVEADNKVVASEEKTVLDSAGKPTLIMPPAAPDSIPKEPIQRTPEQPKADQGKVPLKSEEIRKKSETAVPAPASPKEIKKDVLLSEKKAETPPASQPDKQTVPKQMEKQAAPKPQVENAIAADKEETKDTLKPKMDTAKKSKEKPTGKQRHKADGKKQSKKSYSLQVGAFVDAQKAGRLKVKLDAEGYKSYITTYSPEKGKTFSRVRIGPYETKEQASEVIPELKDKGLEGVIVPGRR
jgi:DedD protein